MTHWNRETNWRQGNLLPDAACEHFQLIIPDASASILAIVASHDCDLAQPPESEAVVEVVLGRRIDQINGNFSHGKNARKLHIAFTGTTPLLGEFDATTKTAITKTALLLAYEPNPQACLTPCGPSDFSILAGQPLSQIRLSR